LEIGGIYLCPHPKHTNRKSEFARNGDPTEVWLLKILSVRAAVSGILSPHINRLRSQVCRKEEEDKYTPPLWLVLLSTEPGS